jgi:hypothetical protein
MSIGTSAPSTNFTPGMGSQAANNAYMAGITSGTAPTYTNNSNPMMNNQTGNFTNNFGGPIGMGGTGAIAGKPNAPGGQTIQPMQGLGNGQGAFSPPPSNQLSVGNAYAPTFGPTTGPTTGSGNQMGSAQSGKPNAPGGQTIQPIQPAPQPMWAQAMPTQQTLPAQLSGSNPNAGTNVSLPANPFVSGASTLSNAPPNLAAGAGLAALGNSGQQLPPQQVPLQQILPAGFD